MLSTIKAGRESVAFALLGALLLLATVWSTSAPVNAASSNTVVGATVANAIVMNTTGCRSDSALELGLIPASTWKIGSAACTVSFGSNDAPARLRVWQRDQQGAAMESIAGNWTPLRGSASWWAAAVSSPGRGWFAGAGGPGENPIRLEHTVDGGATWTEQASCNGGLPEDIDTVTDSIAYFATSEGICRTTDGGVTWTSVLTESAGVKSVKMMDATTGWAVGARKVYKTTNGTTWTLAYTDPLFTDLGVVSTTATGTILITGTRSGLPNTQRGVLISTNSGTTFTRTIVSSLPGEDFSGVMGALALTDSNFIVTISGEMYRSGDGGATWSSLPYFFSGELYERDDGVLFGSHHGSRYIRSNDAGVTWTEQTLVDLGQGHNDRLVGVGSNEMWIAGYNDRRLRTIDGGMTWTSMSQPKEAFTTVVGWSDQRWVAAGEFGDAFGTSDGGSLLTRVTLGTTNDILDGLALPEGRGVLVGVNTILRTDDFGATWTSVTPPSPGIRWAKIVRDEDGVLWAAGSGGRIGKSTNGGQTWTAQTTVPGAPWITGLSTWRGKVWVGALNGNVWRADTAATLSWTSVPTGRSGSVVDIWTIDASNAVVVTSFESGTSASYVSRTTDGGASWSAQKSPIQFSNALTVDDAHRYGWIGGFNSVSMSEDRGSTWNANENVGVSQYVAAMQPLGAGRLIVAGRGSLVAIRRPSSAFDDGLGGPGSGFGACLESESGTAVRDWTLMGVGGCTALAPAAWHGIARTPIDTTASVATTSSGVTGTVGLRFGARTASNQPPGAYSAAIVFDAVAP